MISSRKTSKRVLLVGISVMMGLLMLSSPVLSNINFKSPKDGDILTQKAVHLTGSATAVPSVYVENGHDPFDQGSKINLTLYPNGTMSLDPYIGSFTKGVSNPIIKNGTAGSYNETGAMASSVMIDNNVYKIWGGGKDLSGVWQFSLWTSNNGNSWTGSASNPIFSVSSNPAKFDNAQIQSPSVIKDGNTYKMWYSGQGADARWRIGYATSADGVSWTRGNNGNPVLDLGNIAKFDGGGVAHPSVIKDGNTYKMWYSGVIEGSSLWQIGYATSANGVDWTRQNNSNPVLGFGKKGAYDEAGSSYPRVVKDGTNYRLWYIGLSQNAICYASSKNGVLFGKDSSNPIISKGAASAFDENGMSTMGLLKDGKKFKMWYTGRSAGVYRIGSAIADIEGLGGSYVSKPFNAGSKVTWGKVDWNWDLPSSTSGKVETRTSADMSSWTPWVEVVIATDTTSAPNKYFQYKVSFDTTDSNIIPWFFNFSIGYSQVIKVELSLDNSSWFIANGTDDWDIDLILVEGNNTVYVKVEDTTPYPQYSKMVVRVDTTLPSGHIEIDDGNTFTTTKTVILTLSAQDIMGVKEMRIGNNMNLSGIPWEAFATTKTWDLDPKPGDGVKTVFVEFKDSNGLISNTYQDTIIMDTTPPESSILINENATYTGVTEVQVGLKSTDKNGIKRIRVSTDEDFNGAEWVSYISTLSISVPDGDGDKTVYAEFEDLAGLTSKVSDTIILDTTKPTGGIEIDNGTDLARQRSVHLSLWADDLNGIKDMMISNYPDFVDGVWEDFSSEKMWTIPNNIGENSVFARFRDNAGLVSEQYSDSTFLYTKTVMGGLVINDGDEMTSDPTVTLAIELKDDDTDTKMVISNNANFAGANYREFQKTLSWNVSPSSDGIYTVYLKFKDKHDIESIVYSDSILLDRTPPEISILAPNEGDKFKNGSLKVSGTAFDSVQLGRVEVSIDDGPWIQMQDMGNWSYRTILTIPGSHTITARAEDQVGNSASTSVSVIYPKKKKHTEPGFEALIVLTALSLIALVIRYRKKD